MTDEQIKAALEKLKAEHKDTTQRRHVEEMYKQALCLSGLPRQVLTDLAETWVARLPMLEDVE